MSRPLWQIVMTFFVVMFAVRCAALAFFFYSAAPNYAATPGAATGSPVLAGGYVAQSAAGLATALGLWLGRSWVVGAILTLGTLVAAVSILEGFFLGVAPPAYAVSQVLVAALAAAGLAYLWRREFGGSPNESDDSAGHARSSAPTE